ncbi:unnamed protein product [Polarella glacialis]|uniref:Acetyl-coenzyme A transporter 1 n=1 Tax=Polarella glacialis TaxID=89957 RepID=A0A813KMS6_POLGL|nr:unnamed protein product [Polarella glacialis]
MLQYPMFLATGLGVPMPFSKVVLALYEYASHVVAVFEVDPELRKMAFAVTDSLAPLKFQENGIPKEHMAYMTSLLMPVYILLPVALARWTAGSAPFDLALKAYQLRVLVVPAIAILAYYTPKSVDPIPWGFYAAIMTVSLISAVASQAMFVSSMAFFAQVSDPAMGGTYMTLLNTMCNLGGMWPGTVTMKLVDGLSCQSESCTVKSDGFYTMAVVAFHVGVLWYVVAAPTAKWLQHLKPAEWRAHAANSVSAMACV